MNKTRLAKIGVAATATGLYGAATFQSYQAIGNDRPAMKKVHANRVAYVSAAMVAAVWFLTLG